MVVSYFNSYRTYIIYGTIFYFQSKWWAVILIALGLILFMGLFIKVCAVHTPSSNPKAPPAQHWGDTLRRRRSHPRQQQRQGEPLQQMVGSSLLGTNTQALHEKLCFKLKAIYFY